MKELLKNLFHFHSYKHVKYIDQWSESCGLRSLEQCSCGKKRVKEDYSCSCHIGVIYYYHHAAYPKYL